MITAFESEKISAIDTPMAVHHLSNVSAYIVFAFPSSILSIVFSDTIARFATSLIGMPDCIVKSLNLLFHIKSPFLENIVRFSENLVQILSKDVRILESNVC